MGKGPRQRPLESPRTVAYRTARVARSGISGGSVSSLSYETRKAHRKTVVRRWLKAIKWLDDGGASSVSEDDAELLSKLRKMVASSFGDFLETTEPLLADVVDRVVDAVRCNDEASDALLGFMDDESVTEPSLADAVLNAPRRHPKDPSRLGTVCAMLLLDAVAGLDESQCPQAKLVKLAKDALAPSIFDDDTSISSPHIPQEFLRQPYFALVQSHQEAAATSEIKLPAIETAAVQEDKKIQDDDEEFYDDVKVFLPHDWTSALEAVEAMATTQRGFEELATAVMASPLFERFARLKTRFPGDDELRRDEGLTLGPALKRRWPRIGRRVENNDKFGIVLATAATDIDGALEFCRGLDTSVLGAIAPLCLSTSKKRIDADQVYALVAEDPDKLFAVIAKAFFLSDDTMFDRLATAIPSFAPRLLNCVDVDRLVNKFEPVLRGKPRLAATLIQGLDDAQLRDIASGIIQRFHKCGLLQDFRIVETRDNRRTIFGANPVIDELRQKRGLNTGEILRQSMLAEDALQLAPIRRKCAILMQQQTRLFLNKLRDRRQRESLEDKRYDLEEAARQCMPSNEVVVKTTQQRYPPPLRENASTQTPVPKKSHCRSSVTSDVNKDDASVVDDQKSFSDPLRSTRDDRSVFSDEHDDDELKDLKDLDDDDDEDGTDEVDLDDDDDEDARSSNTVTSSASRAHHPHRGKLSKHKPSLHTGDRRHNPSPQSLHHGGRPTRRMMKRAKGGLHHPPEAQPKVSSRSLWSTVQRTRLAAGHHTAATESKPPSTPHRVSGRHSRPSVQDVKSRPSRLKVKRHFVAAASLAVMKAKKKNKTESALVVDDDTTTTLRARRPSLSADPTRRDAEELRRSKDDDPVRLSQARDVAQMWLRRADSDSFKCPNCGYRKGQPLGRADDDPGAPAGLDDALALGASDVVAVIPTELPLITIAPKSNLLDDDDDDDDSSEEEEEEDYEDLMTTSPGGASSVRSAAAPLPLETALVRISKMFADKAAADGVASYVLKGKRPVLQRRLAGPQDLKTFVSSWHLMQFGGNEAAARRQEARLRSRLQVFGQTAHSLTTTSKTGKHRKHDLPRGSIMALAHRRLKQFLDLETAGGLALGAFVGVLSSAYKHDARAVVQALLPAQCRRRRLEIKSLHEDVLDVVFISFHRAIYAIVGDGVDVKQPTTWRCPALQKLATEDQLLRFLVRIKKLVVFEDQEREVIDMEDLLDVLLEFVVERATEIRAELKDTVEKNFHDVVKWTFRQFVDVAAQMGDVTHVPWEAMVQLYRDIQATGGDEDVCRETLDEGLARRPQHIDVTRLPEVLWQAGIFHRRTTPQVQDDDDPIVRRRAQREEEETSSLEGSTPATSPIKSELTLNFDEAQKTAAAASDTSSPAWTPVNSPLRHTYADAASHTTPGTPQTANNKDGVSYSSETNNNDNLTWSSAGGISMEYDLRSKRSSIDSASTAKSAGSSSTKPKKKDDVRKSNLVDIDDLLDDFQPIEVTTPARPKITISRTASVKVPSVKVLKKVQAWSARHLHAVAEDTAAPSPPVVEIPTVAPVVVVAAAEVKDDVEPVPAPSSAPVVVVAVQEEEEEAIPAAVAVDSDDPPVVADQQQQPRGVEEVKDDPVVVEEPKLTTPRANLLEIDDFMTVDTKTTSTETRSTVPTRMKRFTRPRATPPKRTSLREQPKPKEVVHQPEWMQKLATETKSRDWIHQLAGDGSGGDWLKRIATSPSQPPPLLRRATTSVSNKPPVDEQKQPPPPVTDQGQDERKVADTALSFEAQQRAAVDRAEQTHPYRWRAQDTSSQSTEQQERSRRTPPSDKVTDRHPTALRDDTASVVSTVTPRTIGSISDARTSLDDDDDEVTRLPPRSNRRRPPGPKRTTSHFF